jgi:hypothetical protein
MRSGTRLSTTRSITCSVAERERRAVGASFVAFVAFVTFVTFVTFVAFALVVDVVDVSPGSRLRA